MTYTITPPTTALLLIDPQREYFDVERPLYTPHSDTILPNLVALRDAARQSKVLTVIVQHEHKRDGSDVGRMGDFDSTPVFGEGTRGVELIPEMTAQDGDILLKKTRYSAFVNTPLHAVLTARGIDTIIVSGLMTNYCCVTTARHGHDLDYKVVFALDANGGPDMPDLGFGPIPHAEVLRGVVTSLAGGVAEVKSTADIVKEMLSEQH